MRISVEDFEEKLKITVSKDDAVTWHVEQFWVGEDVVWKTHYLMELIKNSDFA